MDILKELYQETILDESSNPKNYGIPGWGWRNVSKECECQSSKCDKVIHIYYTEKILPNGDTSLEPWFGTKFHVKRWTWPDAIYGPYNPA